MFDNFFKTDISGEIISSLIVMGIMMLLAVIVGIQARHQDPLKKPRGLLLITELGVKFFDNFATNLIGNRLPHMGGFIFGVAVYLFIAFIFGLTGLPSPVTYMAVPLSLGLTTFLLIHITSARFTKLKYFKRYVEPLPIFLPINLISMWAPLLSLSLRLFGNAVSGWVLMTLAYNALEGLSSSLFSFMSATFPDGTAVSGVFIAPFVTPLLHAYFDLFSGFIQTTVFISLTVILIGQEVPEDEENIEFSRKGGN